MFYSISNTQRGLAGVSFGNFLIKQVVEELKADLTAKGWTISNVKTEDGCYEVYGKDEKGKKVEIFFDPATFEAKGSDD